MTDHGEGALSRPKDTRSCGTRPRVSVCVPTYGMGQFIGEALDSVYAQTFRDFEVIVSDNNSDDDTARVLEAYSKHGVQVHRNACTVPMYSNFNKALSYAKGEFIKFLCADDLLCPTYLEDAVRIFDEFPSVGIVTAPSIQIDGGGDVTLFVEGDALSYGGRFVSRDAVLRRIIRTGRADFTSPSHVMHRAEVFHRVGGFKERLLYSDFDHMLRVLDHYDLGWIGSHSVKKRSHSANSTSASEPGLPLRYLGEIFDIAFQNLSSSRFISTKSLAKHRFLLSESERFIWFALKAFWSKRRAVGEEVFRILSRNNYLSVGLLYTLLRSPLFLSKYLLMNLSRHSGASRR